MRMIEYILGAVVVAVFYLILKKRRQNKNAELSGGFDSYVGLQFKESELLRVLVLEELNKYRHTGYTPYVKKCSKRRCILTAVYLLANFLLLMTAYYKSGTGYWCAAGALLYTYLYYRFDPVDMICAEIKKQPDRDISQIVMELISEEPPKNLKIVGIGAFALSVILFFTINTAERFYFAPADGGYSVEKYRPGIFTRQTRIPQTHQGEPVVAIGKYAFESVSAITQVTIPETVVRIDSYAFKNCSGLERVKLPDGLQVLNGESFKGCASLREIVIPEGVEEIRGNTFENCSSLKKVVLHDGIVDIHAYAFRNCKALKQIILPEKITQIHANTFENCQSLREIEIPEGVTKISAHAFHNCDALQSVFIPDSVREIRSSAFRSCSRLEEVAVPEGVVINERAFKDSPTKVVKKIFTDEQVRQILKETEGKDTEVLYYVSKIAAPGQVQGWDSVTILLVDDDRFELDSGEVLQAMESDEELLKYLEKAKAAGFTEILFGIYSPMASEIVGEPYFVSGNATIDETIEECRKTIAEESNG